MIIRTVAGIHDGSAACRSARPILIQQIITSVRAATDAGTCKRLYRSSAINISFRSNRATLDFPEPLISVVRNQHIVFERKICSAVLCIRCCLADDCKQRHIDSHGRNHEPPIHIRSSRHLFQNRVIRHRCRNGLLFDVCVAERRESFCFPRYILI